MILSTKAFPNWLAPYQEDDQVPALDTLNKRFHEVHDQFVAAGVGTNDKNAALANYTGITFLMTLRFPNGTKSITIGHNTPVDATMTTTTKQQRQDNHNNKPTTVDRFGCEGLKLATEAELAESGITVDTAAKIILLVDGKSCALLKEAAIHFFASKPAPVMSSPGWANMRESAALLMELLEFAFSNKK
jgi:hypothetical protein